MGIIIDKCKEDAEPKEPYKTHDSQIVYNVPLSPHSKKERKRRKYRLKKKIEKQYLII